VSRAEGSYDPQRAAAYWSGARHEREDELAAVLSLGEPTAVNEAYDAWETGLLLEALGDTQAALGLDLGTGVGRVAVRVAPRLRRLVCGDLAPGMLARLRENARREGVRNLDPVRIRSDCLPIRTGSVDLVLCLGLLEHLPRSSQSMTLSEAARVLRPGGRLALVLNNASSTLLRDPTDNPYRDGLQRENGYYCSVVSESAILDEASAWFEDEALGANLFYSLHRHAARLLPEESRRDARLRPFFERAADWDIRIRPLGPLPRSVADHHLHLLTRR